MSSSPNASVALSNEHTEFRWLAVDEAIAAFMWPGQRRAVREVVEALLKARGQWPELLERYFTEPAPSAV